MSNNQFVLICSLGLAAVIVYLFASAPPPLIDASTTKRTISVKHMLEILNHENSVVRTLYTKTIVGQGKKQGIKFDENWEQENIVAGPLPAQFLRETARFLERSPVPLGLFLGSDYAINQANFFEGQQLERFKIMKQDRKASYFYVEDALRYAYMFPDIAAAKPCVSCHNDHPDTPKSDWKMNDVMGATTWTYPDKNISYDDLFIILEAVRDGFRQSYSEFIKEIQQLENPPKIGMKWPEEGYFVPDTNTFITKANELSAAQTLLKIFKLSSRIKGKTKNE